MPWCRYRWPRCVDPRPAVSSHRHRLGVFITVGGCQGAPRPSYIRRRSPPSSCPPPPPSASASRLVSARRDPRVPTRHTRWDRCRPSRRHPRYGRDHHRLGRVPVRGREEAGRGHHRRPQSSRLWQTVKKTGGVALAHIQHIGRITVIIVVTTTLAIMIVVAGIGARRGCRVWVERSAMQREVKALVLISVRSVPAGKSRRWSRPPSAGSPGRGRTSWLHPQAPSGSAPMSSPRPEWSAADRQHPPPRRPPAPR